MFLLVRPNLNFGAYSSSCALRRQIILSMSPSDRPTLFSSSMFAAIESRLVPHIHTICVCAYLHTSPQTAVREWFSATGRISRWGG